MGSPYFVAGTIDDLMREVAAALVAEGRSIAPRKGAAVELNGVLLELSDPRARLSRTEARGKLFSCLGEFCWYMARSDDLSFIRYYIPSYPGEGTSSRVLAGYGPRLFEMCGANQVDRAISILRKAPFTRRAVVSLLQASDLDGATQEVPCTCTLQFLLRDGQLQLIVTMRSNDLFLGLPHDVFAFTMIQELVARSIGVEVGSYKHFVGSMHFYEKDREAIAAFLREGWQSTRAMPAMPDGDPWPAVAKLLLLEQELRTSTTTSVDISTHFDNYWADIARLLVVLRHAKNNNTSGAREMREKMAADVYDTFIDAKIGLFTT